MSSRISPFVLATVLLGSWSIAESVEIATAPVPLRDGNEIRCLAVNTGDSNVSKIAISMSRHDSAGNRTGGGGSTCANVGPKESCGNGVANFAQDDDLSVFCEITYPSGKVRGTVCNITLGLCSDAR
jgi:hypothetical protein